MLSRGVFLAACVAGLGVLAGGISGCEATPAPKDVGAVPAMAQPPGCDDYASATAQGSITDAALAELSGLAFPSTPSDGSGHGGLLWGMVDGPGQGAVYAIETGGRVAAVLVLDGVMVTDPEDVSMGRCGPSPPSGKVAGDACIWVADTGDNDLERSSLSLIRVAEPDPAAMPSDGGTLSLGADAVTAYSIFWPDGARNVEAMVALPDGLASEGGATQLLLFTKEDDGQSEVWRVAPQAGGAAKILRVGTLDLTDPDASDPDDESRRKVNATAADLSADGRGLLVRTYSRVWLFEVGDALRGDLTASAGESLFASLVGDELPDGIDEQGEAITWDPVDGGYWHSSEYREGIHAKMWRITCE